MGKTLAWTLGLTLALILGLSVAVGGLIALCNALEFAGFILILAVIFSYGRLWR